MVKTTIHQSEIRIVEHILSKPTATSDIKLDKWTYGSRSGYEIFCFKKPSPVFIGDGILAIEGIDKPGPGERCG